MLKNDDRSMVVHIRPMMNVIEVSDWFACVHRHNRIFFLVNFVLQYLEDTFNASAALIATGIKLEECQFS